jgi:hypothetical protein
MPAAARVIGAIMRDFSEPGSRRPTTAHATEGEVPVVKVLLAFLLMAGQHAQAAETAAIQLSCTGLNGALNDSLVINLAARTVSIARIGGEANINRVDETSISFVGSQPVEPLPGDKNPARLFIAGRINRLPGTFRYGILFCGMA